MKRQNNEFGTESLGFLVFETINSDYSGKPKILLNNCSSSDDGLLYFLIATGTSWSSSYYLVIGDLQNV